MSTVRLPDFPWDALAPARARAAEYPDGVVDLSIGTPVDPTPPLLGDALAAAGDAPGYPTALGTADVRRAAAGWLSRRLGVQLAEPFGADPSVIPTVGSKELVALLPTLLGLQGSGTVVLPEVAYPTYEVGAVVAGLQVMRTDTPPAHPGDAVLVWLNSPGNPHGRVLTDDELRAWVAWGRAHGVPVVADECYIELGWDVVPRSVLHPDVAGADHTGLLAVHSLSKQSTAAGYRAGLLSGDPALVRRAWEVRRHLGLLVPTPVQAAMAAALADDEHVAVQRERYRRRRDRLAAAVRASGARIDHSEAGLYLWVSRDEDCWTTIDWLAGRGIVAAPGSFYGPAGSRHVRMALTATDERIDAAVERLMKDPPAPRRSQAHGGPLQGGR